MNPTEGSTIPGNEPAPVIIAPPEPAAPLTNRGLGVGEKDGLVIVRLNENVAVLNPAQAIEMGRDLYQRGERLKREARKALVKRVGKHEADRIAKEGR